VTLVTMVTDEPSPEHVLEWMNVRGYRFPVLWDDGYFDQAGIEATPETWVLDREGRLVFDFIGTTGTWDQDVGWMVEAVLEG
jgi:hypothetical protein